MDTKLQKVYLKGNRNIQINILPGHFATNHSHVNYFVDLTQLKTKYRAAKLAAEVLAAKFSPSTLVDTIICLEGTEMIGSFLAESLSQTAPMSMNSGIDIHVLTPELNVNNQMIFQHNTQGLIAKKGVLLLLSSVTTGKTIKRTVDCLQYYQGLLAGIGAIFSAKRSVNDTQVYSIFTEEDLPDYKTYIPHECEMCRENRKIDAIINSIGYTLI